MGRVNYLRPGQLVQMPNANWHSPALPRCESQSNHSYQQFIIYMHSHLCLYNKTRFLYLKNITKVVTFLLLNKVRSGAPIECTCRLSASTFLGKMGARLLSAPKSSALKSEYQAQNCPSPLRIRAAWAPSLCLDQYCFAKLIKQGTALGRKGFTSQVFKFACLLHRQNTGKPSQVQIDEGFIE